MAEERLNVFGAPPFNNILVGLNEISHKPYGSPGYKPSDKITININFQDLVLDIASSYIYIEGTFESKDATKPCYLTNNALAFLFDDIRYQAGGEILGEVRNPGITSALKLLVSSDDRNSLLPMGWGLHKNEQSIIDAGSRVFSGKLPLKYLMGFAEDYTKAVINLKHELTLIIARSFNQCYGSETAGALAELTITKIEWRVKHLMLDDEHKLNMVNRLSSRPIRMAFRSWDLYELPSLRQTKDDVWSVKTTTLLETPRYILLAFQRDNATATTTSPINFSHVNISNIRVYLNSNVYPYERWNLDFDKNLYSSAYSCYVDYQSEYYNRPDHLCNPMLSYNKFKNLPVFVINCSHQSEAVSTSTVDLRIEFEATEKFPSGTRAYLLLLHDTLVDYNPTTGHVQKILQ